MSVGSTSTKDYVYRNILSAGRVNRQHVERRSNDDGSLDAGSVTWTCSEDWLQTFRGSPSASLVDLGKL